MVESGINNLINYLNSNYQTGDRIKSERELSQELNVSRASLRESLVLLKYIGVITTVENDGMYFGEMNLDNIVNIILPFLDIDTTVDSLLDLRKMIEVSIVRSLDSNSDINPLSTIIDEMNNNDHSEAELIELDFLFHHIIFCLSQNKLLIKSSEYLNVILKYCITKSRKQIQQYSIDKRDLVSEHTEIYNYLNEGKFDEAALLLIKHLQGGKMKIVVCIKQVPASDHVQVDPETGVLLRDGAGVKMNPFDLFALETANKIKEKTGAIITAITMGPPNAKAVLHEAFALGADEAILITDRKFGGADVLATSYTIAQSIKYAVPDFDIIICGKQTIDGDTAQVGPSIAEHLQIPHLSWVTSLDNIDNKGISTTQEFDKFLLKSDANYPLLLCVEKDIYEVKLPSYTKMKDSASKAIIEITSSDLVNSDQMKFGLNGSPTQVERIFEPSGSKNNIIVTNDNSATKLYKLLVDHKVVEVKK